MTTSPSTLALVVRAHLSRGEPLALVPLPAGALGLTPPVSVYTLVGRVAVHCYDGPAALARGEPLYVNARVAPEAHAAPATEAVA